MQAVEHIGKKSILVDLETHRRISRLREQGQTFGDVVAESITVLEMERGVEDIPCIDEISDEELERRSREMIEHPELSCSLEDIMQERAKMKGLKYV